MHIKKEDYKNFLVSKILLSDDFFFVLFWKPSKHNYYLSVHISLILRMISNVFTYLFKLISNVEHGGKLMPDNIL